MLVVVEASKVYISVDVQGHQRVEGRMVEVMKKEDRMIVEVVKKLQWIMVEVVKKVQGMMVKVRKRWKL